MSNLLEGLNDMQRKAVTTTEGPLLILAGAGSGKTKVLTHRTAYILEQGLAMPWQILAITFTNKAAGEMVERIGKIVGEDSSKDMWIKTFHSAAVRILRRDIDKIGFTTNFNIYDANDQKRLIKDCLRELNLNEDNYPIKSILSKISNAKDEMISCDEFAAKNHDFRGEKYALIYKLYQKKLKESNALDFDDLIAKTVELFKTDESVLSYYQNKFKYIMVDEYQDTNNLQYELISLLAEKHRNLCVVGDDDQSIYKFRGANIRNILDFESEFTDAVNIKLEQNYRSTQTILDAANAVIANNIERKDKKLWTNVGEGEKITVRTCEDQIDEAMYISQEIERLVSSGKYTYKDIAVLYRTNAQTRALEDNLSCPYRVLAGLRFYDTKEIKDILSYLRVIFNPHDDINLKRIINVPKRGIGDTTVEKISAFASTLGKSMYEVISDEKYLENFGRSSAKLTEFVSMIEDLIEKVGSMPMSDYMDEVYEKTGYMESLVAENNMDAKSRIENLEEFKSKAFEYDKNAPEPTFEGFLDNISLVSDVDNYDQGQDAIVLMTLHSAKGLEFPVVFMCGLEKGLFPSYQSEGELDKLEEERRLCYVGITRAKEKLYITYALQRIMYGKTESKVVSEFVGEIPEVLLNRIDTIVRKYNVSGTSNASYSYGINSYINENPSLLDVNAFIDKNTYRASQMPKVTDVYSKGERVSHRKFGEGMIIGVSDKGDDVELEISFDKVGTRTLMASFAKLKKI
ncbi:MAG: ATP-dependent DNA helicase PcrA [Ruminococcaceae bacterium]|nr:ATP-dependent DNA helicase PcrA [Oscillospiraceae bacterium]